MLAANETVAEEYFWREIPFLYRTHEAPEEDKVKKLSTFINNFGYHIHMGNEIRPKEIQKRAICIDGDIGKLLCELCLKPNAAAKSQVFHT